MFTDPVSGFTGLLDSTPYELIWIFPESDKLEPVAPGQIGSVPSSVISFYNRVVDEAGAKRLDAAREQREEFDRLQLTIEDNMTLSQFVWNYRNKLIQNTRNSYSVEGGQAVDKPVINAVEAINATMDVIKVVTERLLSPAYLTEEQRATLQGILTTLLALPSKITAIRPGAPISMQAASLSLRLSGLAKQDEPSLRKVVSSLTWLLEYHLKYDTTRSYS